MPSFTSEGQQVPHDYVPVAVLAHLGDLTGGHYRAALRLTVGDDADAIHTHNTLWALTGDNAVPQVHPLPGLPEWICRNTTLIFLLKKSQVDLFRPLQDPDSDWLRLQALRRQVAINRAAQATLNPEAELPTGARTPSMNAEADKGASQDSAGDSIACLVRMMQPPS